MPTRPNRSLVIVNWNTRDRLVEALDSLASSVGPDTEILVVDNASTDDSVARARVHPTAPRVIVRERNDGFAAGVNTGIVEAVGTVIILLNSDARVEPGAVDRLVAHLGPDPAVAIVGGRVLHPDGRLQQTCFDFPTILDSWLEFGFLGIGRLLGMRATGDRLGPVGWVSGAWMAFGRSWAIDLGGFDERFFLYAEDIDFCRRARQQGRLVHYAPDATVLHATRGSDPEQANWSPRAVRARLDYHAKHDGSVAAAGLRVALTINWLGMALVLLPASLLPGGTGRRARERLVRVDGLIRRAGAPA